MVSKEKNKDKGDKKLIFMFVRYVILLGLMFTLPLIYLVFTPLTIYPSALLLNLLGDITVNGDIIVIDSTTFVQIIPACVAGSAYLLLLILNLSIPMDIRKRVKAILLSFLLLLILNVFRIFLLATWYHNGVLFFEFTHALFWYVLSTVFVVLIWFFVVKIYKIKKIPVYTDIKYLVNNIKK